MDRGCRECLEIFAFEQALDVRASALVARAKEFCRPVIKRNNQRWTRFGWWCRLPIIGSRILNHIKEPFGLEPKPEYYNEAWYREEGGLIEVEAHKLEQMKGGHLAHWGDETVSPGDSSDPGGYYTPCYAPRSECYARNLLPFGPGKYDFSSAAGIDKLRTEDLVICSKTKRLVPLSECNFRANKAGVTYVWRGPSRPPERMPSTSSQPGFNEWRDQNHYAYCKHNPECM